MYNKSTQTKKKIIKATVELLKSKDTTEITIRDIASITKIGVGLINYHFQSKENMISAAIESYMEEQSRKLDIETEELQLSATEKLKLKFMSYGELLAESPRLNRLAVVNSLTGDKPDSCVNGLLKGCLPIMRSIYHGKEDSELCIILLQVVSALQMAFLRNNELSNLIEIDFFDDEDREYYVEELINNLYQSQRRNTQYL